MTAYRLLGYEKRLMRAQDFNNDQKHAGVLGSGHRVTALYEIVPAGKAGPLPEVDPLKYQEAPVLSRAADDGELLTVKLRYKEPMGQKSKLLSVAVKDEGQRLAKASADFRFAAAVVGFGLVLRGDLDKDRWSLADAGHLAERALGSGWPRLPGGIRATGQGGGRAASGESGATGPVKLVAPSLQSKRPRQRSISAGAAVLFAATCLAA